MAVNSSRSMNASLQKGAVEGSEKSRQPHTESTPENLRATMKARKHLMANNGFSYGGDSEHASVDL